MINCLIFGCKSFGSKITKQDNYQGIIHYLLEEIDSFDTILKTKIILLLCFSINDISSIIDLDKLRFFDIIYRLRKDPQVEIKHSIHFFEKYISLALGDIVKGFKNIIYAYIINPSSQSTTNMLHLYLSSLSIVSENPHISLGLFKRDFLDRISEISITQ